jgi:ketosteroid isomerase-like protein
MEPKELVKSWVEAFNRRGVALLVSRYADDAGNYQVAEAPVSGKEAIGQMFRDAFATVEISCEVENIIEDGEWDKLSFLKLHGLPITI